MPRVYSAINAIEELRRLRGDRSRDVSIASTIESLATNASRTQRKLGELIEIWERHVPPTISNRTALTGIRGGVLHVAVDSSAAAFELDRLLRGGLINELRREFRGTLLRVKWKIAPESSQSRNRRDETDRNSAVKRKSRATQ